jgi:predicted transcriptional regulator
VAEPRKWAFITSHGAVLIEVSRHPDATVREIAGRIGLTERQAHRVLNDLVTENYVVRDRIGRRNNYRVNDAKPMRHALLEDRRIGEFLRVVAPPE